MKINRLYSFSIFILIFFLLVVFALFVTINNALVKVQDVPRILIGSLFIILMIIGLIMFYFLEVKKTIFKNIHADSLPSIKPENDAQMHDDTKLANVEDEEKVIDLKRFLPRSDLNIEKYAEQLLKNMSEEFKIVQGVFYIKQADTDTFKCCAQFAYYHDRKPADFRFGETLPGQALKNRRTVSLTNIPENYFTVASGLGIGPPREIVFVPVIFEGLALGLIEYATFTTFNGTIEKHLDLIAHEVAGTLVNLYKK